MNSHHVRTQKRILKRILVLIFLAVSAALLYFLIDGLAVSVFGWAWFRAEWFQLTFAVVVAGLLFKPVDHLVFLLFKGIFVGRHDQHFMVLSKLARELVNVMDLQELGNLIVNTFGEVVHVRTVSLMVFQKNDQTYQVVSAYGIHPTTYKKIQFTVDRPIIDAMRTYNLPLLRDQLRKLLPWQEANQLTNEFESLQASCIIPIICEEHLIGSLNLGARSAAKSFQESDLKFFHEFANEIAPVIRNAIMVEELKTANEELKQVQTELIQTTKLSAIEQLATGLAHEIHNPLTIISGKAQVLLLKKDKKSYDEKVEEVLKTIVKQTKRAADITRKLLMFTQGRGLLHEPIPFETIVSDTVALVSYQTALDDIRVTKQVDRNLPPFYGNPSAFREIFLNLFLNAVQAVEKSGIIQISVRHKKPEQVIEIIVADSGPGIPEEHVDQIFNPFFTTRPEGTGLGLFVTQQIVHRYQGSIRIESKEAQGTVVIIQLPISAGKPLAPGKTEEVFEDNPQLGKIKQFE